MADLLTKGALATIMQGGDYTEPVVQVLSVKKMNTGSGQPEKDRYRAYLSDGQYTVSFAMMTAQVYAQAGEKGLPKFTIMKIKRFITSVVNNTEGKDSRVLLILDMVVLKNGDEVGEKFGTPVPYSEGAGTSRSNGTTASTSLARNRSDDDGSAPPSKMSRTENASCAGSNNVSISGQITHPIASLSPYHNKWIIKARVLNKSEIRKWSNNRGEGQLFSFDLADESGEIKCTAFRDMVEKYFDLIKVDKVYYISKCQIKPANKQFSTLKNDYEMTTTTDTVIEECQDDDMAKVQTQYNFVDISKIAEMEPNQTIDVIGVVKSVGEVQTFQARSTGRELKKREIQLLDQSNTTVTMTLWGAQAETFSAEGNPVIALKGARISEFGGGKSVSTIASTMLRVNPEIKECFRLKGWYDTEGVNCTANDISARTGAGAGSFNTPWVCFKEAADQQQASNSENGFYYLVKGTILLLRKENCLYKACDVCNKKVVDNHDGTYRCEKCNMCSSNFKFRFLCSMNVGDWSGNQWVSTFNEEAEKIVGMNAQEAGQLMEADKKAFDEMMEKAHFKEFVLKCRAKMETYNDEHRLKTVAVRADPINYEEYNAHLISNIKRLANL